MILIHLINRAGTFKLWHYEPDYFQIFENNKPSRAMSWLDFKCLAGGKANAGNSSRQMEQIVKYYEKALTKAYPHKNVDVNNLPKIPMLSERFLLMMLEKASSQEDLDEINKHI